MVELLTVGECNGVILYNTYIKYYLLVIRIVKWIFISDIFIVQNQYFII